MRRTAVLLLACLTLAGCSDAGGGEDKPALTPSATSSAPTTPPLADQIAACTDALAAGKSQDGPECARLSPDDLLTAVQDSNQRGRDALQSALDEATTKP